MRQPRQPRGANRALDAGTREHYQDASLYDHEYRRRRRDIHYYKALAATFGGPVLELGCGTGRIALPLARAGQTVVGLDLSAAMLARASQRVARLPRAARGRVKLALADFSALPLARRFPLVIAAFNTLQHVYTADALIGILGQVRRHLAPEGAFAFDVLNPDLRWLMRDPQRRWARTRIRHPVTGERLIYSTNHTYDPVSQVAMIRIYYDPPPGERGRSLTVRLAHRQYFPRELELIVRSAGLAVAGCYGDFEGDPLDADSESQVLVCARPTAIETVRRRVREAVSRLRSEHG